MRFRYCLAIGWIAFASIAAAKEPHALIQVPHPLSGNNPRYPLIQAPLPAVGKAFRDASFGTVLTRVTQAKTIGGSAAGRHEYSRFDPFNKDQTLILLLPEYDWRVYKTGAMPYNTAANQVRRLAGIEEPRWDPKDPNIIWCLQGFRIVTVNVRTGKKTVVKDFAHDSVLGPIITAEPDLYRITMKSEGESSSDKRYWALLLQGSKDDYRARYLFTWDKTINKVLGVYKLSLQQSDIDWAGMSTKGNWVLIGGSYSNGAPLKGLTMANRELTQFHRLDYATAHSDVGLDASGNEVIVMQNVQTDYIDLIPLSTTTKPILTPGGSYAGTNRVRLIRLYYNSGSPIGLNSGIHLSCNFSGYCVVSTTIDPELSEQNWLDRTITLVRLDRKKPKVYYLAKVYNTTSTFWEETHATITNDGTKVVWAENWGENVGDDKLFLMQLEMPSL